MRPPSSAVPGPVRGQGWGDVVMSGGLLAVVGKPQNFGSSVRQSSVKLWPWADEEIRVRLEVQSRRRAVRAPVLKVVPRVRAGEEQRVSGAVLEVVRVA